MVETLNHPESKQSQEYHEQSPDNFVDSLKIFDSYEKVPAGKEKNPEWQMPFTGDEQELAKGIRGELEELANLAKSEGRTVSIPELFSAFEDKLRASDADEETKDQLFLAATKMRYHLQLRFDKANEGESVTQSTPTTDELYNRA